MEAAWATSARLSEMPWSNWSNIRTLNVAGSRESKEPGIYNWVKQVLADAFFWSHDHPTALGGPGEG